jgi:hypothetical protein
MLSFTDRPVATMGEKMGYNADDDSFARDNGPAIADRDYREFLSLVDNLKASDDAKRVRRHNRQESKARQAKLDNLAAKYAAIPSWVMNREDGNNIIPSPLDTISQSG